MLPSHETWVAVTADGSVVGFLALRPPGDLDQLYLAPGWTGRGIGSRLLDLAKARMPGGFELYTFQVNSRARRFYERHGLEVVDLDGGERNQERQPDVRYAWRPRP
jgi:ribosomal protein S18 acetylase RimI-like enzyme